ncbi:MULTISPECIES: winged helix-turn-helix domain-containing protein [unclassified Caballeronia]|uniref:winged helix-turn-helix domain-containing protein n=1 Tax=unclassified Caballeronia TaxID=2646786 RepID=UPI002027F9CE|nr:MULTISPECIES: winged helix-turn-helix domain-containing protein [unclassified Caballeronia]
MEHLQALDAGRSSERLLLRGSFIINQSIIFSKETDSLTSIETRDCTRLSPIACRALIAFTSRPFEVIKRDDLLRALWYDHGFVVTGNSLNQTVCKLRENFRSISRGHDLIKTIPRIGYSFVATVQPDRRSTEEILLNGIIPSNTSDAMVLQIS